MGVPKDRLPHAESHDPAPASSEPTALPHPGRPHLVWDPCRPRLAEPHHGVHQLPAHACGEAIWERRMRETRPSGVMRGEPVVGGDTPRPIFERAAGAMAPFTNYFTIPQAFCYAGCRKFGKSQAVSPRSFQRLR